MKEQNRPVTTSKAGRWITGLVAALFLLGAVNEVVDPVTALGHMPFALARCLQLGTVLALEVYAALALLLFPSRRAIWLSAVLLTAFSSYLLHLIHAGAASCGCFDSLGIERSPKIALATNLAALCGLAYALRRAQHRNWTGSEVAMCLGLTVISVTFACATTRVPKHLALEQLLGSQAAGRDILLKISPACDACLQTTRQVLSEYPARRVIAITYVNAGRANRDYMERFHIPLIVFGVQEFFALDGTLEVPRCYRVQGTQLIACQTRTSREPRKTPSARN
jgi:hypothetical protein